MQQEREPTPEVGQEENTTRIHNKKSAKNFNELVTHYNRILSEGIFR